MNNTYRLALLHKKALALNYRLMEITEKEYLERWRMIQTLRHLEQAKERKR